MTTRDQEPLGYTAQVPISPTRGPVPGAAQELNPDGSTGIPSPDDRSRDFLGEALARAPIEDEAFDADELQAIREGLEDRRAGRVVTTRELERELGI